MSWVSFIPIAIGAAALAMSPWFVAVPSIIALWLVFRRS